MDLQERLERDLKSALLSGDKKTAETLKGLKNTIQYEAVRLKIQKSDLSDEQVVNLLAKEAKKCQEAAELYQKAGEDLRASTELDEKKIIEQYMPDQLTEDEVANAVQEELSKIPDPQLGDMGKIIGAVKERLGAQAEGSLIARLVKQALENK